MSLWGINGTGTVVWGQHLAQVRGLLRRWRARSGRLWRCVIALIECPSPRSGFAGFRFPPNVILVQYGGTCYGLSYMDVAELLAERGMG